jgi:hypothetical protein
LLAEAARVVHPGGMVLVIHWRWDLATPRGPSIEIRPRPEQIMAWAEETRLLEAEGPVMDLPPWHYGLRLLHQPIITGTSVMVSLPKISITFTAMT